MPARRNEMVLRVTNQMQQNNALQNIFKIREALFRTNERIATGKRINRPSDDPSGVRLASNLKVEISQTEQFSRNIDNNRIFVDEGDAALDAVGLDLIRAEELAVSALSATASAETRATIALEVGGLIDNLFLSANTKVTGQYIFAGTNTLVEPFQRDSGGLAVYTGNSDTLDIAIDRNQTVSLTHPGSDVFGTDLNPAVNVNDSLSSLNDGTGVPAGSFTITDREGVSAVIAVAAGDTVNDVITAINGAVGLSVTASLNSSRDGLLLTDTSTVISQPLTVTEVAGGTTAASLGILGQRDGDLVGRSLNPIITANTLIADLDGGNGLVLGQIDILNGGLTDTVDLSGAVNVGDVLVLITGAATGVTATINSQGNGFRVVSNDPTTVAVIQNVGSGDTASILGIGGGGNLFVALESLEAALLANDTNAITGLLDALSSSGDHISDTRAIFGVESNRMDKVDAIHDESVVNLTEQLSAVEDSDIIKDASDIAILELAFEATLDVTARILQTSLLNFLR